jgi:hypothetical protein
VDTSYEWKAVTLLGLASDSSGSIAGSLRRSFPFMLADLGLNLQDQGNIIGALGLAWGVFAVFSGRLSDAIGHRKVLIPAVFLFSLLSGASDLATGFAACSRPSADGCHGGVVLSNELNRNRRGISSESPRFPAGPPAVRIRVVRTCTRPDHRDAVAAGRAVVAMGVPDGQHSRSDCRRFALRCPARAGRHAGRPDGWCDRTGWQMVDVFKSRNIVLSDVGLFCAMTCVFVLGAMVPNYLLDYLKLSPTQMGFVMSGLGFGGFRRAVRRARSVGSVRAAG